jgi:hypothetical protein
MTDQQTKAPNNSALKKFSPQPTLKLIAGAVIILLSVLTAWSTGFDAIDDHLFLNTLKSGHILTVWDITNPQSGRFCPLNGTPYNLLLLFTNQVQPSYLHVWNALELLLLCSLTLKVLTTVAHPLAGYLGLTIFILQPSFLTAANRLLVPERPAILAIFALLYFYNSHARSRSAASFLAALLSANWAIYCKEPICGAIIVFACCQLTSNWRKRQTANAVNRRLDIALAASGLTFLAIYFTLVSSHHGESYAAARRFLPWFANLFQNVRNYALFSDPFLFFIGIPLVVVRAFATITNPNEHMDWADSALFGGVAYAGAILTLNMSYTSYYLLPASALAWPALVRFVEGSTIRSQLKFGAVPPAALIVLCAAPTQIAGRFLIPLVLLAIVWSLCSSKPWARALPIAVAGLVFLLNSLPGSFDAVAQLKTRPIVYGQTIQEVAQYLRANNNPRQRIFIAGVSASSGIEGFTALEDNLAYLGFTSRNYDMLSCTPLDGPAHPEEESPFTVFRDPQPKAPLPRDLLVIPSKDDHPCATTGAKLIAVSNSRVFSSVIMSLDKGIQLAKDRVLARSRQGITSPPSTAMLGVVPN